eukprot:15364725-Ditylum_brightwellii.AAC.1
MLATGDIPENPLLDNCLERQSLGAFHGGQVFSNKCANIIDGSVKETNTATHTHEKSCISLIKSLSCNAKSYKPLAEISSKIEDQPPSTPCKEDPIPTTFPKHNSLKFQLSYAAKKSGAGLASPKKPLVDEDFSDVLAFPHLPAAFLSLLLSPNNLTCDTSMGYQAFMSKTSSYNIVKGDDMESYGWFIETDADDTTPFINPLEMV